MVRALWLVAVLVCLALINVSCGTGATAGAPDDDIQAPAPPDVTFVSDPATVVGEEPVPDGYARLLCSINWPAVHREVGARHILSYTDTIEITVTGSGIATPVTATITRPDATASVVVLAGTDRAVDFEQKDGATHLSTTSYTIANLAGGETYSLTYTLMDDYESNDTAATATTIPTDGTPVIASLDTNTPADIKDYYRFDVTGTPNVYVIKAEDLVAVNAGGGEHFRIFVLDTDGATTLAEFDRYGGSTADVATSYEFTADGTYYVEAAITPDDHSWEYVLSVNEDEGSADVDFTVQ